MVCMTIKDHPRYTLRKVPFIMVSSRNSEPAKNKKLQDARRRRQWTIAQASEKIGVDIRTYSRWEQGERRPNLSSLKRLCEVFKISAQDLGFDISTMHHEQ
jgi:DNA-binding XRE family transcriptional regulator